MFQLENAESRLANCQKTDDYRKPVILWIAEGEYRQFDKELMVLNMTYIAEAEYDSETSLISLLRQVS